MNPKSHKVFKEGIAEKVEVHPSVVDEFVNFYYEKVRENLSTLTSTNIFLDGLGTFSLRKMKVKKAIIKNKNLPNLAIYLCMKCSMNYNHPTNRKNWIYIETIGKLYLI